MRPADDTGPDSRTDPTGVDNPLGDVLRAVRALALGLDRYRQALGGRYAVGVPEIVTLGQLLFDGPVRASEISARTGLTQSSVTALLDRLEGRGLVTRVRPPANRRVVMVEVTAEGRTLARAIFGPMQEQLAGRLDRADAPRAGYLVECLEFTGAFLGQAAVELREAGPV